jgi:hypothetical protein
VGVRAYLHRLQLLPTEVITAQEASFDLLRRDDGRSRARATEQLKRLVEMYPKARELRADQLLALSLDLDELKMRLRHGRAESQTLENQIASLQDHQSPSTWREQVEQHRRALERLKNQTDPLEKQISELDVEIERDFGQLTDLVGADPNPPLTVIRAEAVYFGVNGADQTLELSEHYRNVGGRDGWNAIALAEYALNAHVAPDTKKDALAGVDALKKQDSGLIRAYVLAARLREDLQDTEGATQDLDAAAAFNPHHDTARELMTWQHSTP